MSEQYWKFFLFELDLECPCCLYQAFRRRSASWSTVGMASEIPGECPYSEDLGRAGWTILHTAAAVFPNKPSTAQVAHFQQFITSWANVYACSHCAFHMRQMIIRNPPTVAVDKRSASRYVCQLHNEVNSMLMKPVYNCDPDIVLKRWHPTYPEMTDTPMPEEQLRPPPASWNTRGSDSWRSKQPSQATSSSSALGNPSNISNDERDPALVLARLKACQVYCPDKDSKNQGK